MLGIWSDVSYLDHSTDAQACVKPFSENDDNTWIGPPHPISNLRSHVFPKSEKFSDDEKHFYSKALEIHSWNQQYWENHNKDFEQSKKSYIDKVSKKKKLEKIVSLTAEEMSHFYKEFLDRNHKKHISYNWAWYRKNFYLLFLAAKANISKLRRLVRNS
ncbi:COA8 family protein CBG23705, mitochondrial-like isoform X2 [Uloborus diversus]|uniref:COA8 family protein CBG23705, mitochondrial-like isoform X2 n=1 Tax=Uloborus diversus TaxID=327109 RepID=UPI0024095772|nr:COA8 family protein CBG23705, mitochondrial-like isoform X2 [Uloborus diversus]XP_054712543.1 COA8 family protein CBG23705, mitochondrial-like isoform X2 [Uloborus diversus]